MHLPARLGCWKQWASAAPGCSLFCKAKPKHKVPDSEVPLLLQSQDLGHLVRAALTHSEEPSLNLTPETSFLPVNEEQV